MKLKVDFTPENVELIKRMASDNKAEAFEAQAAVAKFVMPVIESALLQAKILSALYEDFRFSEDDNPSIPLDIYADSTAEGTLQVWSQNAAGGLGTNFVMPYSEELKFQTYSIDTAISFDAKHARKARLPVISKSLTKLSQEVLLKMERTAANQIFNVLAQNATDALAVSSATTGKVLPEDFNSLLLKMARLNKSWVGGTPVANAAGKVTDVFMSPERMFDMRAMAYNPLNTTAPNGIAATNASGAIAAPESVRAGLFNGAGVGNFYGVTLHEVQELGPNQKWTNIFKAFASAESVTFGSGDDLMLAVNMGKTGLIRPVEVNAVSNTEMKLVPDDQFVSRQQKIGFYGKIEEGRLCLDNRGLAGIRVKYA